MGRSIEVGWSLDEPTFLGGLWTKSTAARRVQFFGGGGKVVSFDTTGTFFLQGMLRGLNFYFVCLDFVALPRAFFFAHTLGDGSGNAASLLRGDGSGDGWAVGPTAPCVPCPVGTFKPNAGDALSQCRRCDPATAATTHAITCTRVTHG